MHLASAASFEVICVCVRSYPRAAKQANRFHGVRRRPNGPHGITEREGADESVPSNPFNVTMNGMRDEEMVRVGNAPRVVSAAFVATDMQAADHAWRTVYVAGPVAEESGG